MKEGGSASRRKAPIGSGELRDAMAAPPPPPMVRTQLYLNRSEYEFVQAEAARRGETMAAIIRSYVGEKMAVPDAVWDRHPLLDPPAVDPSFAGHPDGAVNHDHYIYGGPKKWVRREGTWVEAPPLPDDYFTNRASADAYDRMVDGMI